MTYRLEKRRAKPGMIDLPSLHYKYEVDTVTATREVFDDELELEEDLDQVFPRTVEAYANLHCERSRADFRRVLPNERERARISTMEPFRRSRTSTRTPRPEHGLVVQEVRLFHLVDAKDGNQIDFEIVWGIRTNGTSETMTKLKQTRQ
ncbi:hypothetical protein BJY52DRAFT_1221807 [Lactarius psammicola]|nr:hypothetical protein BJY52DRAFT_1221807 [Lactarius psammicola]